MPGQAPWRFTRAQYGRSLRVKRRVFMGLAALPWPIVGAEALAPPGLAARLRWAVVVICVLGVLGMWLIGRSRIRASCATRAGYAGLPADSPLVRTWAGSVDVVRREAAGRYGGEAASHAYELRLSRIYIFYILAGTLLANWFLAAITGIVIAFNFYYALIPVGVYCLVIRSGDIRIRALTDRAKQANERLRHAVAGVIGTADRPIPSRAAQYVEWCGERGLEPYPFGRPDWADPDEASHGGGRLRAGWLTLAMAGWRQGSEEENPDEGPPPRIVVRLWRSPLPAIVAVLALVAGFGWVLAQRP